MTEELNRKNIKQTDSKQPHESCNVIFESLLTKSWLVLILNSNVMHAFFRQTLRPDMCGKRKRLANIQF